MFERRFREVLAPDLKYLWHCHLFTRGLTELAVSAMMIFQTLTHSHYRNILVMMLKLDILAQLLLVNTQKLVPAVIKQYIGHNFVSK